MKSHGLAIFIEHAGELAHHYIKKGVQLTHIPNNQSTIFVPNLTISLSLKVPFRQRTLAQVVREFRWRPSGPKFDSPWERISGCG